MPSSSALAVTRTPLHLAQKVLAKALERPQTTPLLGVVSEEVHRSLIFWSVNVSGHVEMGLGAAGHFLSDGTGIVSLYDNAPLHMAQPPLP